MDVPKLWLFEALLAFFNIETQMVIEVGIRRQTQMEQARQKCCKRKDLGFGNE